MTARYDRSLLPDPVSFYESAGLVLKGPGKWKTTSCQWHGGSDSMRINSDNGAFKCMACEQHGGDVLDYFMLWHGAEFMEAAEALGATYEDHKPSKPKRKTTLSAGAALALIQSEAWFVAVTALATANPDSPPLTDADRLRLKESARVIAHILEEAAE